MPKRNVRCAFLVALGRSTSKATLDHFMSFAMHRTYARNYVYSDAELLEITPKMVFGWISGHSERFCLLLMLTLSLPDQAHWLTGKKRSHSFIPIDWCRGVRVTIGNLIDMMKHLFWLKWCLIFVNACPIDVLLSLGKLCYGSFTVVQMSMIFRSHSETLSKGNWMKYWRRLVSMSMLRTSIPFAECLLS